MVAGRGMESQGGALRVSALKPSCESGSTVQAALSNAISADSSDAQHRTGLQLVCDMATTLVASWCRPLSKSWRTVHS